MSRLFAPDVEKALREAGARVVTAGYLESGLYPTVHPDLSAAVVDLHLGDGSGAIVCWELQRLGVPFVIHTSYPHMLTAGEWPGTAVISKPAPTEQIVGTLAGMLD
jgi:ActR/RegA family two-component response regulator